MPPDTAPLSFTFAVSSYDHIQAVVDGRIPIEGADPLFIRLPIPEMFRRFVKGRDWDVSEMSFVQYGTIRASGDDSIVGIPVFTSRLYRQTAIFVRSDRIHEPKDLIGSRIGIVAWANSAAVWARGLLSDMHSIEARDVTWYQGGVERPGRPEVVLPRYLSDDVTIIPVADRGIEEMLWAGDLEAIIVPAPPLSVETSADSGGLVRRLYEDSNEAERLYREKTRCLPIMHVVAMTRDLVNRDPTIPAKVYVALESARVQYFARIDESAVNSLPIPWVDEHIESLHDVFGGNVWPYGIEANMPTLQTYARYLQAQGLVDGLLEPANLFPEWQSAMDSLGHF